MCSTTRTCAIAPRHRVAAGDDMSTINVGGGLFATARMSSAFIINIFEIQSASQVGASLTGPQNVTLMTHRRDVNIDDSSIYF